MQVEMLTSTAGRPSYRFGDIVELDARLARAWIQAGLARPAREERLETAVSTAQGRAEQAITRRGRRG